MEHIVIMPEDCYKATSGRFKDCIVRKSKMGVETLAALDEFRYVIDLIPEAIEQAWEQHTCDAVITPDYGGNFPCKVTYVPKRQKFKMEKYA